MTQHAPIIICDDEPQIAHLYEILLARVGMRSLQIPTSDAVVAYIQQYPVSLIISELNRPNINGLDLLKAVRSSTHNMHVPFMLVTSTPDYESRKLFATLSGSAFLTKPIDGRQLTHVITQTLTALLARPQIAQ